MLDFDAELLLAPLDHGVQIIHILAARLEILGASSLLSHTENDAVRQAEQFSHLGGIEQRGEDGGFKHGISIRGRWEQEIVPTIV